MLKLTYSGRVLSKKNSKNIIRNPRTGKPLVMSNPAARANEEDMVKQFSAQKCGLKLPVENCSVNILIYEPNWQKRDLDNQATAILDALVLAGILVDDSIKCVKTLTVSFGGVDNDNPRAEILIEEEK